MLDTTQVKELVLSHVLPIEIDFAEWSDADKDIIVSAWVENMSMASRCALYDDAGVYCGVEAAPYNSLMNDCKNSIYSVLEGSIENIIETLKWLDETPDEYQRVMF